MKVLLVLLFISINGFAQTFEESLQSISHLSDSAQVDSMIKLSRISVMKDEHELGLKQAKWGLKGAQKNNLKHHIPFARFYVARNFNQANLMDSAIANYLLALEEIKKTRYSIWKIYIISALGNNYRQKGDYKSAITIQLEAIEGFQEQSDSSSVAELYTEIGYSYDRMKDYRSAIKYHRKAIRYLPKGFEDYKNFILGRIAIANDDLGQLDSAHFYNQKVLGYYVENGDSMDIGRICSNIGNTYLKQGKWRESQRYLERAERLNLIHGDEGNKAINYINLGTVYTELGLFSKAKVALNKGVTFSIAWKDPKFLSESYFFKSKLFEKLENSDSALFYFKAYKTLEDSLYAIEKVNQIKELSAKYEVAEKEKALAEEQARSESLAKEAAEAKLLAESRNKWIILLLSIVVGVVLFFLLLKQRNRRKAQAEKDAAIIEERDKGTKALFLGQEEERKRISKDLHDGVGQQLSGLKMAFQKLGKNLEKKLPEHKNEIDLLARIVSESADEVRSISHQMMPRALTELGLLEAMEDMLEKSLGLSGINYEFEHFGLNDRLSENVEISLYRVCQELINNIIKHSGAKKVTIQLFKNGQKVIMVVEDDGNGMKSNQSDGHGLLNMRSRINTLHGEMNLEPSPGSGTLATVRIPI